MISTTVTAISVQFGIEYGGGVERLPYGAEKYCATLKMQIDESAAEQYVTLQPPVPITQRTAQLFALVLGWAISNAFELPKNQYSHAHGTNMQQLYTDAEFASATVAELVVVATVAEWLDSETVLHLLMVEMREMV